MESENNKSRSILHNLPKLLVLALIIFLDGCIDNYIIVELPFIQDSILPFRLYPILAAIMMPFWGFFADVYGRQRTLALSGIFIVLLLLLQALIPSDFENINTIFKILTGLFKAHFIVGKILSTELFHNDWKPIVLAILFSFERIGSLVGGYKLFRQIYFISPEITLALYQLIVIILSFITNEETLKIEGNQLSNDLRKNEDLLNTEMGDFMSTNLQQQGEISDQSTQISRNQQSVNLPLDNCDDEEQEQQQQPSEYPGGSQSERSNQNNISIKKSKSTNFKNNLKSFKNLISLQVRPMNFAVICKKLYSLFASRNTKVIMFIWILVLLIDESSYKLILSWLTQAKSYGGLELEVSSLQGAIRLIITVSALTYVMFYPIALSIITDYQVLQSSLAFNLIIYLIFFSMAYMLQSISLVVEACYMVFHVLQINAFGIIYCVIQRFTNDLIPSHNRGKFNALQVSVYFILNEFWPYVLASNFPVRAEVDDDVSPYVPYFFCLLILLLLLLIATLGVSLLQFSDEQKKTIEYHPDEDEEERQTLNVDE